MVYISPKLRSRKTVTRKIQILTEQEKEIDRYMSASFDIRDYDIMEDFVDTLSGSAHDRLASAIQGRGAFRRFKDVVINMGIDQEWYDFQSAAVG